MHNYTCKRRTGVQIMTDRRSDVIKRIFAAEKAHLYNTFEVRFI